MLHYILFNTLIYGSIAFVLASFYAYGKFLNATIGTWMIMGTYTVVALSRYGMTMTSAISILAILVLYLIIHAIIIKKFPHETSRDLFGFIFTLGGSLLIENIVNMLYGPNAVSLDRWTRSVPGLVATLVVINLVLLYLFRTSYNGLIWQAIYNNTSAIRSLGVRVNRMLSILMSCALPSLIFLGIIITNEGALKPSDNLFYLIKGIGIMILVGLDKKEYIYLGALVYVTLEYLLFITRGLPIGRKETLILALILILLIIRPQGLFSLRKRTV